MKILLQLSIILVSSLCLSMSQLLTAGNLCSAPSILEPFEPTATMILRLRFEEGSLSNLYEPVSPEHGLTRIEKD